MITKVNNIQNFRYIRGLSSAQKKSAPILHANYNFSLDANFTSNHPSNIRSFKETLEQNYFNLPSIQRPNGEIYQFKPDKAQIECARNLFCGNNVIYCAPTGSGKTAVAHYIMQKNIKDNGKTVYTIPLVALANDKYREFTNIYGAENVGIMTGANKFNTHAPILIMTTEIYNNQTQSPNLSNIAPDTVIFDEAHYMSDEDRGNVWEKSIINTPSDTQMLLLSATIGNVNKLEGWINSIKPDKKTITTLVKPEERYVPLRYYVYSDEDNQGEFISVIKGDIDFSKVNPENLSEKQKRALEIIYKSQNNLDKYDELRKEDYKTTANKLLEYFGQDELISSCTFERKLSELYPDIESEQIEEISALLVDKSSEVLDKVQIDSAKPDYSKFIKDLNEKEMLPAIIFKLSKKQCDYTISNLKEKNVVLTTDEERAKIKEILEKYKQQNIYLGKNFDSESIYNGYASHHAGNLPQYRKLIEELFSKKLIKVVAATSTLSAGINMPARTVVITDVNYTKFNPKTQSLEKVSLTPSEFHQMSGRAGRRGIDNLGNVVLYNLFHKEKDYGAENQGFDDDLNTAYELLASEADDLISRFKPDWQMITELFDEGKDRSVIDNYIDNSFRMYVSNDKEAKKVTMENCFNNYMDILFKKDFLEINLDGKIETTPKGKILAKSQGLNPILLSTLIFDEKLKDMSIEQIAQVAAFIAGSSDQREDINEKELVINKFKTNICQELNKDEHINNFLDVLSIVCEEDNEILMDYLDSKIKPEDIVSIDAFSGYIGYLWAHYNDEYMDNGIGNFSLITRQLDNKKPEFAKYTEETIESFDRKALEGNVYKILSETTCVLKQISSICNFALSRPDLYPNRKYYEDLNEKAQLALLLTEQEPINSELAL